MKTTHIPENESLFPGWLERFSYDLVNNGTRYGITPAEISSLNSLIHYTLKYLNKENSDNKSRFRKQRLIYFVYKTIVKMKQNPDFKNSDFYKRLNNKME